MEPGKRVMEMLGLSSWLWIVTGLFFLLTIHPFVTYPASLWLLLKLRGKSAVAVTDAPQAPRFTICMCAYNEEKVIVAKAENLLAMAASVEHCEILIYVDGDTDRTAALLQPYSDRLRIFIGSERRGKSHGMRVLTEAAKGDILVFTDANVTVDPKAIRYLGRWFADPRIGCVSGRLVYSNPDESAMSSSGSLYWRVEEAIKRLESDAYNVIGADGSLFATRRELYLAAPDNIIDDFYVSMQILIQGYRAVSEPKAIAHERSATDTSDEFRRKVRIACQAFNVHRVIWPEVRKKPMLAYCYLSHRLLKWLIGYNLVLAGILGFAACSLTFGYGRTLAVIAVVGGVFSLALLARNRTAHQILAILVSFAGAAWGVWRSIKGDQFQTWTPPASAR